ncbi:MAG: hypothetical protein JW800_01170 [Candidatus Omnitrophica bacterium]|nr:hypothetical protein [Candidatus Omnitrophota bacterium]
MAKHKISTLFTIVGIVILSCCFTLYSIAAEGDLDKEKKKAMIAKAKEELDNTVWDITLTEMGTTKKTEDKVRFVDGKVESDMLTGSGFQPTNYTVSIKEETIVVWETMQSSEKSGLAFWRAEIEGKRMRGVLSHHKSETNVKDYSFVSTGEGKELFKEAVEEMEGAPAAATTEASEGLKEEMTKAKEEAKPEAKEEVKKVKEQAKEEVKAVKEEVKKTDQEVKKKRWWQR